MGKNKKKQILPNTGSTVCNITVSVILIIAALAVLADISICINFLLEGHLSKIYPYVLFMLTYVAIIKFSVVCFIKQEAASIYSALSTFSLTVIISTIIIPNVDNVVFLLALLITLLTPLMRNHLTAFRRCVVIIIVIFIAATLLTVLKFYYGYCEINTSSPIDFIASIFTSFRLLILWTMFSLLYLMRSKLLMIKYKDEIAEKGLDAVREEYNSILTELLKAEAIAKIEPKKSKHIKAKEERKEK